MAGTTEIRDALVRDALVSEIGSARALLLDLTEQATTAGAAAAAGHLRAAVGLLGSAAAEAAIPTTPRGAVLTRVAAAAAWLLDHLATHPQDGAPRASVLDAGVQAGHTVPSLRRAATHMRVIVSYARTYPTYTVWALRPADWQAARARISRST